MCAIRAVIVARASVALLTRSHPVARGTFLKGLIKNSTYVRNVDILIVKGLLSPSLESMNGVRRLKKGLEADGEGSRVKRQGPISIIKAGLG